jgi:hypothetical protein
VGVTVVENDFLVHLLVSSKTRAPAFPPRMTSGLSFVALSIGTSFAEGSTSISDKPSPLSDVSIDQRHLALISRITCPRFNFGIDHNLTVPLVPAVINFVNVGFFLRDEDIRNLTADTPSRPFDDELIEPPPNVIRGNGF